MTIQTSTQVQDQEQTITTTRQFIFKMSLFGEGATEQEAFDNMRANLAKAIEEDPDSLGYDSAYETTF
jgi:hypothetical protein